MTESLKVRCRVCRGIGRINASHFGMESVSCRNCGGTGTKTVSVMESDES
jgi:DnaJ-class molecular chaperone